MQIKIKSVFFAVSLFANGIFVLLLVLVSAAGSLSKNFSLSVFAPGDGYITAAVAASAPKSGEIVFNAVEIAMKPHEKAFLQFSFLSSNKQANLSIAALYDPQVVSVAQTGFGIEITAVAEGDAVIQILANDGFRNIAFVTVTDDADDE